MTPEEKKAMQEKLSGMESELEKYKSLSSKGEEWHFKCSQLEKDCADLKGKLSKSENATAELSAKVDAMADEFASYKTDMEQNRVRLHANDKKAFFAAHPDRILPAQIGDYEMLYDLAVTKGEEALTKWKSDFAARPRNPMLSEYEQDSPEAVAAAADTEDKIREYCDKNKLNYSDSNDYSKAAVAVGYTYEVPDTL